MIKSIHRTSVLMLLKGSPINGLLVTKTINGKERRNLKIAKVRPVDLKIGKNVLTPTFEEEARKILSRDGMIKFSHSLVREDRNQLIAKIEPLLQVDLVERVGKTLTFCKVYSS